MLPFPLLNLFLVLPRNLFGKTSRLSGMSNLVIFVLALSRCKPMPLSLTSNLQNCLCAAHFFQGRYWHEGIRYWAIWGALGQWGIAPTAETDLMGIATWPLPSLVLAVLVWVSLFFIWLYSVGVVVSLLDIRIKYIYILLSGSFW